MAELNENLGQQDEDLDFSLIAALRKKGKDLG